MIATHQLAAGYALTVTPAVGARVSVACREDPGESAFVRGARTFGPYLVPRTFDVRGDAALSAAVADVSAAFGGLLLTSDGAPADAARATADVNPDGDDNGLTFTAQEYGAGGNDITVTYVDPGANDAALSVSVYDKSIVVFLATGEAGAIESTAAEVLAAVEASAAASELVAVALLESDTNFSDGSGVVTAMASTALENGAGTGIGLARPGALCIDTTNGAVYRNGGTRAAPDWHGNGQFLSTTVAVGDGVAHTSNTAVDVCSLTLPAGEWDVSAIVDRSLTGVTATRYAAGISLTSATMPSQAGGDGLGTDPAVVQFATFGTTVTGSYATPIPPVRVVLAEPTPVYLVVQDLFSAGTMVAYGTLRARRIV